MTAKRIDHTGIMVKDIETSIAFYQDVLGMQLKDRITHTNGIIELAFLGFQEGPETEIELIQGYSSELPAEGKVHHIALLTEDIAAEFTHAKRQGAVFIDEEITTLPNGYRYFYMKDQTANGSNFSSVKKNGRKCPFFLCFFSDVLFRRPFLSPFLKIPNSEKRIIDDKCNQEIDQLHDRTGDFPARRQITGNQRRHRPRHGDSRRFCHHPRAHPDVRRRNGQERRNDKRHD